MRTAYKFLTALAVFFIVLCLCGTAYAQGDEEPHTEDVVIDTLLPPGTGTVVDTFIGNDGRAFYTIQTPAGNTFYLIIDFTRHSENVYFLDAVNERDLLALAQKANLEQPDGIPGDTMPPNGNTGGSDTEPPGDGQTGTEPQGSGNSNAGLFAVVLLVIVGGGAVYFFRKRGTQKTDSRDEYEELEEYTPDAGDSLETWGDDDE